LSSPVGGLEHERGDEQGGDRVGPVEAGHDDDRAGDQGSDEGVQVGEDVLEAALDRHASVSNSRQARSCSAKKTSPSVSPPRPGHNSPSRRRCSDPTATD
jgi:hypothetical protein